MLNIISLGIFLYRNLPTNSSARRFLLIILFISVCVKADKSMLTSGFNIHDIKLSISKSSRNTSSTILNELITYLKNDTVNKPIDDYIENRLKSDLVFIDIDRDGDLDIIHQSCFSPQGYGAYEIPFITVFTREEVKIKRIFGTMGYIVTKYVF